MFPLFCITFKNYIVVVTYFSKQSIPYGLYSDRGLPCQREYILWFCSPSFWIISVCISILYHILREKANFFIRDWAIYFCQILPCCFLCMISYHIQQIFLLSQGFSNPIKPNLQTESLIQIVWHSLKIPFYKTSCSKIRFLYHRKRVSKRMFPNTGI